MISCIPKQTANEWSSMQSPYDWTNLGDFTRPLIVRRDQIAAFFTENGKLTVELCGGSHVNVPESRLYGLAEWLGVADLTAGGER